MTGKPEPRDVEARLRASLRAYADVVDETPAPSAARRDVGVPARSLGRRWRTPALVAAAVLAVAGGAWFVADPPDATSPTAAPASTTADSGAEAAAQPPGEDGPAGTRPAEDELAAAAAGPAGLLVVPPPAEIGVAYPFDLYTHCGILGADVAGIWFAADPPLVVEFGPPDGWGDPYQRGTLTLESADESVFRDDAGHELMLRAAADSERPPPCA